MDFTAAFILIIVAVAAYLLSIFIVPSDDHIGELKHVPQDDVKGMSLTRINGFGNSFSGKFRKARLNGIVTFVTYNCIYLLFVPLLPFEAYRVSRADDGKSYWVYGKEKMRSKEGFSIVLRSVAIVCVIVGIILMAIELKFKYK